MGMEYTWAGSASYPRFDRELCAVAEIFGGVKTEHLKNREDTENSRPFGYWFGFLSSDNTNEPKFSFPKETDEILTKWFNNIYGNMSVKDTTHIWQLVAAHPEIKEISRQLWEELEACVETNTGWKIY